MADDPHSSKPPEARTPEADAYRTAGVDIDAAARFVEGLGPLARATRRPGVLGGLGGFAAAFDPRAAGFVDPVLVATTDGVGTKLKIAIETGRHDAIGIDLVAMCVNDLVATGAEPLFFLDYFACGRLDRKIADAVVTGIAEGCREAGCALIGGETAEMPGLYASGDYDLAGFAIGAAERGGLLDPATAAAGDAVIGLAASGLHANGFSLVRRIIADSRAGYDDTAPFDRRQTIGDALLAPTAIYVRPVLAAVRAGLVKSIANITGGGLLENLPRALPDSLRCALDAYAWPLPPLYVWLRQLGGLSDRDLARTFNCGIGMTLTTAPGHADALLDLLRVEGVTAWTIGRVIAAEDEAAPGDAEAGAARSGGRVAIAGTERAWRG
ncbi:MAG: phosphoribosylformylglycinamidine cyclo-ligase [Alphaproteobacteria bacterium]|jgi:phosphoribosylformylglycinamidine cyclo-ligase|nr:phosphoribosylformylglycinamidine cyclo-ligase [Alphaproteobacteria bacterium]